MVTITRWFVRGLSLLVLVGILLLLLGEWRGLLRVTAGEMVLFLCFPVGMCAGTVLGWWRERAGALLTAGALALFYALHPLLDGGLPDGPFFVLLSLPGLMFIIPWRLSRAKPDA